MPKAKKTDLEKTAKVKSLKPLKLEKPDKEKKVKKKEKDIAIVRAEIKSVPKPVKVEKKPVPVPVPVPVAKSAKAVEPAVVLTTEEIALRAYFIAERRQAMGWDGDSAHDWIEAERQLQAEAKRKGAKK